MTEGIFFVVPQISRLPLIIVAYLISLAGIAAISVLTRNQILDVVVYSSIVLGMNALVLFHVPYISHHHVYLIWAAYSGLPHFRRL